MKMDFRAAICCLCVCFSGHLFAATITFDTATSHEAHGISTSSLSWTDLGGGHLYDNYLATGSNFYFDQPTYINSIDLNEDGWPDQNAAGNSVRILTAYNAANEQLFSTTVQLGSYTEWDTWATVDINVGGVSSLETYGSSWASFDNLVINESIPTVPIPAAAWLFGSALCGLLAMKGRKSGERAGAALS